MSKCHALWAYICHALLGPGRASDSVPDHTPSTYPPPATPRNTPYNIYNPHSSWLVNLQHRVPRGRAATKKCFRSWKYVVYALT